MNPRNFPLVTPKAHFMGFIFHLYFLHLSNRAPFYIKIWPCLKVGFLSSIRPERFLIQIESVIHNLTSISSFLLMNR